jgi:peptide/bleomycin uptake transporter
MFVSFFPRPLALTVSAVLWGAFAVSFWYTFGSQTGELLGFHLQASGTKTVGAAVFWSAQFLWFYLYFIVAVACSRRPGCFYPLTRGHAGRFLDQR